MDGFSLFGYLFLLTKYSRKPINCPSIENKQTSKSPPSEDKVRQVAEAELKRWAKSKDLQTPGFNFYFPSHCFPFFLPSSNPNLAWLSALWSEVTWLGLKENVICHLGVGQIPVGWRPSDNNTGKHSNSLYSDGFGDVTFSYLNWKG